MEVSELVKRLGQFVDRYQKWVEPSQKHEEQNWRRIRKPGYTADEYYRTARKIRAEMEAQWDPYPELYALLDELCPVYLRSDARACDKMRSVVARCRTLHDPIRGYALSASKKLSGPDGAAWLERGVAALSIENCGMDYRDTIIAINVLAARAEAAGIDPKPYFSAAAERSSTKPTRGGCRSMAQMLKCSNVAAGTKKRILEGKYPGT
jgi:hypothetical protein